MPIRLHKKDEGPQPAAAGPERRRASKAHGFPRFLLWLLIVAALVAGAYYAVTWNKIQVRGRVTAAYSDFIPEGRCRIAAVNVKVADEVESGQVLLVTRSIDPRSQVPAFEAALNQAKLRLDLALKGGDVGVVDLAKRPRRLTDARQAVAVAKARLEAAQTSEKQFQDLVKAIAANRDKEIEKATADHATGTEKLNQAVAAEKEVAVELAQAKLNLSKANTLYELDAATLNDLQLAQTKYDFFKATAEKAKSATQEARTALDGITKVLEAVKKKYDAELDAQRSRHKRAQAETEVARAFLKHARDNLARAEEEYGEVKTDPKKMQADELDFLKKQVEEAQGVLNYYKTLAGTAEFKSPFDGVVGELNKSVGDVAEKFEKVVSVYDPRTVAIEVYVPEDDFYRVEVGQAAEVNIRGMKITFKGKVLNINTSPARLPGEMKVAQRPERAYDRFITCRVSVPEKFKRVISPAMRANVTIYTN